REPAARCLADAVAHEGQVSRRVGVAVDGEPDAVLAGPGDEVGVEVEAVRVCVDLQGRAGARAGLEHRVEVEVDGRALADLACGEVPDDVDVRVLAGAYHPGRHLLAALREVRV